MGERWRHLARRSGPGQGRSARGACFAPYGSVFRYPDAVRTVQGPGLTVVLPRLRGDGDNADAALILAMYIEAAGHRATVRHSPGQARDRYRAGRAKKPSISSSVLPRVSGNRNADARKYTTVHAAPKKKIVE